MGCEIQPVGQSRYRLVGELAVFHADELKSKLLECLPQQGAAEIDLAQVSEVDTAGIQLLLLAKREAVARGCRLNFTHHSEALLEAINLLNLARDFGDPVVIPSEGRRESR